MLRSLVGSEMCIRDRSYLHASGHSAAGAAELVASRKEAKYSCLSRFLFVPVALEILGAIAPGSLEFLSEVGRRLSAATSDARETAFLFQRISVAIHRFNAALIHESCRHRRRAGPLAIPACVLAAVFSPLPFYTIGHI